MSEISEDIKRNAIAFKEQIEIGEDKGIVIEPATSTSKVNIILDMSKFDLFLMCQYRYYIRYVLEKTSDSKKNESLDRGSLIHEGMDRYYSLLAQGVRFQDRVHEGIMKMRSFAADPSNSDLDLEEIDHLVNVFQQNVEYWRFEDEHLDILLVEQPFAFVLFEDDYVRIIISGKIDLLVNVPAIGGRAGYTNLPIDHKTFSRSFETHRLTNQFQCYASAVNSNYLLVNKIGLHKLDGKSPMPPEEKFIRVPLSYDKAILEDWKQNVLQVIQDEYFQCLATGRWHQNMTSCDKFNRRCEYFQVCDSSGQEAKLWKLNNLGPASPWDVTAKLIK